MNVHIMIITTRLTEQFLELTPEQAYETFIQKKDKEF